MTQERWWRGKAKNVRDCNVNPSFSSSHLKSFSYFFLDLLSLYIYIYFIYFSLYLAFTLAKFVCNSGPMRANVFSLQLFKGIDLRDFGVLIMISLNRTRAAAFAIWGCEPSISYTT
jgi:hypothetical protein